MNMVILSGRLTRDVITRTTPNGAFVASFTLAVKRQYTNEGYPDTDFIQCTAWQKTAKIVSENCCKGKQIALVGNIQTHSWENKDGQKQYSTDVVVEEIFFAMDNQNSNVHRPKVNRYHQRPQGSNFDDMEFDIATPFFDKQSD